MPLSLLYESYEAVAGYLTEVCSSDLDRLRAVFFWTASTDLSSLQNNVDDLPEPDTPLDYLLKINWQMGNHAHFFARLCRSE